MDEFGHILREARETKGLSLAEVQDQIRINSRFLSALEQGEYGVLPTPVHVRGFLRNYARFLGLDPAPLLNRYELVLDQETAAVPPNNNGRENIIDDVQYPPRQDQPFFNPVNFQVDDGRTTDRSDFILRLIIIVALIATLALVANRFIPMLTGNGDGSEALTAGITAAIQNISEQIGPTPETTESSTDTEVSATSDGDTPIISTSRNNNEDAAAPVPLPTRPILPAMDSIQLKLEITERTWMEVTIDNDVVFSGIARKDDPPYEWEASEEAKVNTGNAIAVHVTINDIPWGRMGERGENKEEVWRTTN